MKKQILLWVYLIAFLLWPTLQLSAQPQPKPFQTKKGKWGYMLNDKTVIKPKYDSATPFFKNVAIVNLKGKYGILNTSGEYVVQLEYDNIENFVYVEKQSHAIMRKESFYGIVCVDGKIVVPAQYDKIEKIESSLRNGVSYLLKKGACVGMITFKPGSETPFNVPCIYDDLNGKGYIIAKQNGLLGLIKYTGEVLLKSEYTEIEKQERGIYKLKKGSVCGLYDAIHKYLIPCEYDELRMDFSDSNRYKVSILFNKKDVWGAYFTFSRDENKILSCEYDEIVINTKFRLAQLKQKGLYGLMSLSNGNIITPCEYENIKIDAEKECIILKKNGFFELMSMNGRKVSSVKFKTYPTSQSVTLDNKLFYINTSTDGITYYIDVVNGTACTVSEIKQKYYKQQSNDGITKKFEENQLITIENTIEDKRNICEEEIDGNIYSHLKLYKDIDFDSGHFSFIRNTIDTKDYIYYTKLNDKDNVQKILLSEIEKFAGLSIKNRTGLELKAVQQLSNGDYLLKGAVVGYEEGIGGIMAAPQYITIAGQLVCVNPGGIYGNKYTTRDKFLVVVDNNSLKPKYKLKINEDIDVLYVSKQGGLFLYEKGRHLQGIASQKRPIVKYNNKLQKEWSYSLGEGEHIYDLYETSQSLYALGSTISKGYIGKENPMLLRLDPNNGTLLQSHFERIGNYDSAFKEVKDGKAIIDRAHFYSLEEIEPQKHYPFADNSLGIWTCGLKDQDGQWVIYPIHPGEDPQTAGGWTIYPNEVGPDGKLKNKVIVCHKGKYGLFNLNNNIWSIPCILNSVEECYSNAIKITVPDSVVHIQDFIGECGDEIVAFYGKYASSDNRCWIVDGILEAIAPAGLEEYTIPENVTAIGPHALCGKLRLTIPNSVTRIDPKAYDNFNGGLILNYNIPDRWCANANLAQIIIGDDVKSIGNEAFSNCSANLITIGRNVSSIGKNAFNNCSGNLVINCNIPNYSKCEDSPFYQSSFTEVQFGHDAKHIGDRTFEDCKTITNVIIGKGVTSIGCSAFDNCHNLVNIAIPDSVTSIGERAFDDCYNLTSINIPDSVISLGKAAFSGCRALTSVNIGNKVTSIGVWAFEGCSNLASINIPESVISIEIGAFLGCSGLKNVNIQKGVVEIGNGAFIGCSNLITIKIPNSVTTIGDGVFGGCGKLESITIPNSVTSIGGSAFEGCKGELIIDSKVIEEEFYYKQNVLTNALFTKLTIGNNITKIGKHAFYGCESLKSATIGNSVTSIGYEAFGGCKGLVSITIPDSVTSIGRAAFEGCKSLKSVIIPNSITWIRNNTFYECSSLTDVTIPNSVTSIEQSAFAGCSNLTNLVLGNGVKAIEVRAFAYCKKLTSVTIPESVTSIGGDAFNGCESLKSVYCKSTTPPQGGNNMFYGTLCRVYVPTASVSAYKDAKYWGVDRIVGYDF